MNETGTSSIDAAAIFNISSSGMIRNWRTRWNRCPTIKEKGASIHDEKKETPTPVEGTLEALQEKI